MKRPSTFLCLALAFTLAAHAQNPIPLDTLNGVWLYGTITKKDPTPFKTENPTVKGAFLGVRWDSIETSNNVFNWTLLDQSLNNYANAKMYMNLIFWVGPFAPSWLFDAKTPGKIKSFRTTGEKDKGFVYPDYKNPAYINYWMRMIDSVTAHINKMSPTVKNKIYIYQSAEGSTGDAIPYHGTPESPEFVITKEEWRAIREKAWLYTDSALFIKNQLSKTHLMVNLGSDMDEAPSYTAWFRKNMPHVWLKEQYVGNMYQFNFETDLKAIYDPQVNTIRDRDECKPRMRIRSELGGKAYSSNSWFMQDSVWNFYYTELNALHFGLDMNMQCSDNIENQSYKSAINFFAKYAGQKSASCSPGGFSALRDGLDASDTVRFTTKKFGNGTSKLGEAAGMDRTKMIAKEFEKFGARQDDASHAQGNSWNQQGATKMNDVGWNIFPGNYERYVTQISANQTSIGHWRVGPHDEPYGRFARGTDHATNKDTLFFDVHDKLFNVFPLNGTQSVKVRVVYLDAGKGTFQVQYDAKNNVSKTAVKVSKTNTNKWKEVIVTLQDAYFGNRAGRKADILLVNDDGIDDIFHMVEVTKVSSNEPQSNNAKQAQPEETKMVIQVSPNPFASVATLTTDATVSGTINIQVSDAYGNIMYNKNQSVQPNYSLNLSFLKAGIYTLKVTNGIKITSQTIVKI